MDSLLVVILLGIVEGLTEFIPVSSTGHLILAGELLGFTGASSGTFEIVIQLGAILAVVVLYWRRFLDVIVGLAGRDAGAWAFARNIALGFLPSAVIGPHVCPVGDRIQWPDGEGLAGLEHGLGAQAVALEQFGGAEAVTLGDGPGVLAPGHGMATGRGGLVVDGGGRRFGIDLGRGLGLAAIVRCDRQQPRRQATGAGDAAVGEDRVQARPRPRGAPG